MYHFLYLFVGEAIEEVAKRKGPRKAPKTENAMVCTTYSISTQCAAFSAAV